MIPYNERLWGTSPRDITAAWCSRFVPRPNLEQIIAGAVGAGPPELGYNISFRYPKAGGIETFTRALQTRMAGGQIHTSSSPDVVDWRRKQIEVGGERVSYEALVSTIPLPELLRRMPELPAEIEAAASRLRCTTLTYLNLATRTTPAADFHWIYVPEPRYPFYRAGVYSNAMSSMAPTGGASLYVEMAARGPVSEADLRGAFAGLVEAGALRSPADVVFAEPREIKYAYVIFDHAYYAATQAIFAFLDAHQIFPRGRYGAWTYNAMEDCVLAGREVADTIETRFARLAGLAPAQGPRSS
jgi:protoporphyrinogen oxidase